MSRDGTGVADSTEFERIDVRLPASVARGRGILLKRRLGPAGVALASVVMAGLLMATAVSAKGQGAVAVEEKDWRPPRAETSARVEAAAQPRLLSVQQGRAIVQVAWQADQLDQDTQDCSHFVHAIYASAGFDYPYANSREIYAGNENFARVRYARAGDLIVWQGHMGIVMNPHEHTFYSVLRKGADVQDYESAYWRARGVPRFYRYKAGADGVLQAAQGEGPATREFAGNRRELAETHATGTLVAENMGANTMPNSEPAPTPAVKRWPIYGPPAPPESKATAAPEAEATAVPKSVVIASGKKVPTREEVSQGISELHTASGSVLQTGNAMDTQTPIVIVEKFEVERVDVKGSHGWARMVIESKAMILGGSTQIRQRREKVQWELRRTESGWEAMEPTDRVYVPTDIAVKNLAAQLARLSASNAAAERQVAVLRQEAQLAGILSALLEKQ